MKSIKVCEYSRSRSFHYDLILQDQASGERSQDQWSSGLLCVSHFTATSMSRYLQIVIKQETIFSPFDLSRLLIKGMPIVKI